MSKGKMIILKADGTRVEEEHSLCPKINALQAGVGGNIETVPYFNKFEGKPCVAYCNEEGKLWGLPTNITATLLWKQQVGDPRDILVGDVIILQGDASFMRSI